MKHETKRLVVSGLFLFLLVAFLAAGMAPLIPAAEPVLVPVAAAPERHVSDAQFLQYLEYRVRLEASSYCQ